MSEGLLVDESVEISNVDPFSILLLEKRTWSDVCIISIWVWEGVRDLIPNLASKKRENFLITFSKKKRERMSALSPPQSKWEIYSYTFI